MQAQGIEYWFFGFERGRDSAVLMWEGRTGGWAVH